MFNQTSKNEFLINKPALLRLNESAWAKLSKRVHALHSIPNLNLDVWLCEHRALQKASDWRQHTQISLTRMAKCRWCDAILPILLTELGWGWHGWRLTVRPRGQIKHFVRPSRERCLFWRERNWELLHPLWQSILTCTSARKARSGARTCVAPNWCPMNKKQFCWYFCAHVAPNRVPVA
jgi:hypothetical protein